MKVCFIVSVIYVHVYRCIKIKNYQKKNDNLCAIVIFDSDYLFVDVQQTHEFDLTDLYLC